MDEMLWLHLKRIQGDMAEPANKVHGDAGMELGCAVRTVIP